MYAYRRGDRFIVEFDLPGVEPASIELTVEQNVLTVRAERRFEPREGDEVIVAERPQGTYARQVFLGDALDSERVQATCRLGVLTLKIPVAEAAKPRRVPVRGEQKPRRSSRRRPAASTPAPPGSRSRPPDRRPRAPRAEPAIQHFPKAGHAAAAETGRARRGSARSRGRPDPGPASALRR
jgi:HSP20 family protein